MMLFMWYVPGFFGILVHDINIALFMYREAPNTIPVRVIKMMLFMWYVPGSFGILGRVPLCPG